MFSPDAIEAVRSRIDLVEVIGRVVALRPQGRDLVGLCPFHQEKTPSFHVSPEKQLYYCFGCQAGGDVFDFVMRREGLSFGETLLELGRQAGIQVEENVPPEERKRYEQQERLFEALSLALRFYRKLLRDHPAAEDARAYIRHRGITAESIDRFELGYAPNAWRALANAMQRRGFSEDELIMAGLARRAREGGQVYDRFRGRLMFPIRDERGRLRGFGGRIIGEGEPKYLNSPETSIFRKGELWYALPLARQAIRHQDRAVITEGYMDVLIAHQHGIEETVATLGTAISETQGKALMRHASRFVLAYDADRAGAGAAWRGLQIFQQLGAQAAVARMPEGMDPDDLIRKHGVEAFRRHLDEALPLIEYRLEMLIAEHGLGSPESVARVVRELLPDLQRLESHVAREDSMRRISNRLAVSEESVWSEWKKWSMSRGFLRRDSHKPGDRRDTRYDLPLDKLGWGAVGALRMAEEDLLARMLMEPKLRTRVGSRLEPGDFSEGVARQLAELLLGEGKSLTAPELLSRQEDPELRNWMAALSMQEKESDSAERIVRDELAMLERERRHRQIAELEREIRRLEASGEAVPTELLQRLNQLLTTSLGGGEDDENRTG